MRTALGTLGFFDVSGFTRLSERLARSGKVGAETVTGIVDGLFAALIDDLFAYGGDVLTFSGDALLVWFEGTASARPAAAAALRMQRTIRAIGRVETDRGVVRLRMSAGLHTDVFTFAMLGSAQRSLIALGAAASQTCALEKNANAGEVLVSGATADQLDTRMLGPLRAGATTLRHRATARDDTHGHHANSRGDAARFVPPPLRHLLAADAVPGEHRPLVLSFVAARGLDRMVAEAPTDTIDRLDAVAQSFEAAQERYGITWLGTDTFTDGCAFFCCSGAPLVHEDDDDRMLAALRDVLDADPGLGLAAGANHGRAFSAVIGHPERRTYSVTGDATNLAARVMAHATAGQLLATDALLSRTRRGWNTTAVTPFRAKGKARPVEASEVRAPEAGAVVDHAESPPLIGRDAELARLLDGWNAARGGNGCIAEIVAEPGMGKSRLIRELCDRTADAHRLLTAGDPYAVSQPYFAWRTVLRTLVNVSPDLGPTECGEHLTRFVTERHPDLVPWLPLLAIPIGATVRSTPDVDRLDPTFVQERVQRVVGDLLTAVCVTPTLLVIEDTHWLDDASRALLAAVAERSPRRPWLVVATHRPDHEPLGFGDTPGAITLELQPLSSESATELALVNAGDTALTNTTLDRLVAQSGGNPLFLQELMTVSAITGDLPESVERVIGARIDALAAAPRSLLRETAVLGARVDLDVLAAALDSPVVASAAPWHALADFVEHHHGEVRFRHDLFRLVAYEGLPYRRRRELHGAVGDVMARTTSPGASTDALAPALALHFSRANRYDLAWKWSVRAAKRAREQASLVDALSFFRQALDAAHHVTWLNPNDVADVAEAMGDVGERAGNLDDAHAGYREARRLRAGEVVPQGRLLRKHGYIAEKGGDYVGSLRWYRRALAALADVPDGTGERALAELGYAATRVHQGKLTDARRWITRALPDAEARADTDALAQAFMLFEIVAAETGDPDRIQYEQRALTLTRALGDERRLGSLLLNLGLSAANESRWDDAAEHYAEAEERFRVVGHVVGSALVANNRAEVLTDQGRYDEARALLDSSRRAFRASRYEVGIAITISGLSRLEVRARRFAEAHVLLDDAEARFRALLAHLYVADTLVRQTECLVFEGRAEEAMTAADAASAALDAIGHPAVLPITLARLRACALAQLGYPADTIAEIDRALALAVGDGVDYEIAACISVRASLADDSDPALLADRDAIVERLGIVEMPAVPLLRADP